MGGIPDEVRRAIRQAVHGDPDRPVELTFGSTSDETSPCGGTMGPPHENGAGMGTQNGHARPVSEGLQLDPNVVLAEVRKLNPTLVELALHRVALAIREQELTAERQRADTLQAALAELSEEHDHQEEPG